jgi:fumarate hydratase class II
MAPRKTLYGGETKKAVDNFPISGETVPASVIHWLGRIKGASAGERRPGQARPQARRRHRARG